MGLIYRGEAKLFNFFLFYQIYQIHYLTYQQGKKAYQLFLLGVEIFHLSYRAIGRYREHAGLSNLRSPNNPITFVVYLGI